MNMIIRPILSAALLLTLLSGCASLSKEQCMHGDWKAVGYQDGASGAWGHTQLSKHIDACGDYSISIDQNLYYEGWNRGIASFCSRGRGFSRGAGGQAQDGVCQENQPQYIEGWNEGITQHCTTDNGYRRGANGSGYQQVCPAGLEQGYLSGYISGIGMVLEQQQLELTRVEQDLLAFNRQLTYTKDEAAHEALEEKIKEQVRKYDQLKVKVDQISRYRADAEQRAAMIHSRGH